MPNPTPRDVHIDAALTNISVAIKFCDHYLLDTQNRIFYTLRNKKDVLINYQ